MSNFGVYFQIFKQTTEKESPQQDDLTTQTQGGTEMKKPQIYFAGDVNGVGCIIAAYGNLHINDEANDVQDELPICLGINLDDPSPKWMKGV